MIETATTTAPVFEGLEMSGRVNTPDEQILANVKSAIRRGHSQIWPMAPNGTRVCIVGGGPSLDDTFDELRQLVFEGAKLVTVNGAYHWCLERNLKPGGQVVLDARPANARFVNPPVPQCRYWLGSQCAPETWDAVEGREHVAIWHDVSNEEVKAELDSYYMGNWNGIMGGTTVGTRAIGVLRTLGFLRFDLFGFDSCWMDDKHHAYVQPENVNDKRFKVVVTPKHRPSDARAFYCAPWMLKQAEDWHLLIRTNGDKFLLNVHGDGLLAYMLRTLAEEPELKVEEIS